jgi:hypothetical protein
MPRLQTTTFHQAKQHYTIRKRKRKKGIYRRDARPKPTNKYIDVKMGSKNGN